MNLDQLKKQITYCHNLSCDLIVLHLHWGFEHDFYPSTDQVKAAHSFAEMGIDLIVGHHPHVIQPYELYRTKRDDSRVVPIFYSLGNLVNFFAADYLCISLGIKLSFVKGNLKTGNRKTYLSNFEAHYLKQLINHENQTIVLKKATQAEFEKIREV